MSEHAAPERRPVPPSVPTSPIRHPASGKTGMTGGQTLDGRTNAEMSARFGHDFSSVRIHTDSRAEESTAALGAAAFAEGSDIAFGVGQYQPGSRDTERLLAHELTHVVQQARFGPGDPARPSDGGDASEREASALSEQVVTGQTVRVRAAPGAAIARLALSDVGDWFERKPPDPDTPKEVPPSVVQDPPYGQGGPFDKNTQQGGFTWDHPSILPKSVTIDPGKGSPLQGDLPGGSDAPKPLGPPPAGLDWGKKPAEDPNPNPYNFPPGGVTPGNLGLRSLDDPGLMPLTVPPATPEQPGDYVPPKDDGTAAA